MAAAPARLLGHVMPAISIDWELAFQNELVREAAEYWMALRRGRAMPERSELRPEAMRPFLNYVNLVNIDRQNHSYVITLQGSHTRQVFGHLANQKFSALFSKEEDERWRFCFDQSCNSAKPVRLFTQVGTHGMLWMECEVFIAPLGTGPQAIHSLFWVFVSWNRDRTA